MARTLSPPSVTFKVNRFPPELVVPAEPTPHEFKLLSDLDNSLRMQIPAICIFPHNPSMNGVDLFKVVKNAISRALVYYYPLAGRLREDPSGKLVVECTGEGLLFIEAEADVTLDQFGNPLAPTFLCYDQFVFDVPGSSDILNCPLILFQVTRLKCGGLIIGVRLNHSICDGAGFVQFMSAIAEVAKGATSLSVLPSWERHILNYNSNNLQHRGSSFPESQGNDNININDLCHRTFILGQIEISALRKHIFHDFQRCSSFEILVACVWKCRVLALSSRSTEEEIVSLIWPIDLRAKSSHLKVPVGYYGNAIVYAVVKSTAKEIIENPLTYVLQLIRNGKEIVPEDPYPTCSSLYASINKYIVTDLRIAASEGIDFGWGKTVFSGPPLSMLNVGFHLSFNDKNEQKAIMVPICLPSKSMEIFERELNNILDGLPLGCVDYIIAKSKL